MFIIDLISFSIPLTLIQYSLPYLPKELTIGLETVVWQVLVGLPIMLTSAIIISGMLFELGQSAGLSSSEAVNWLPISPREYVAASSLSIIIVYSPLLMIGVGLTLPLALKFGLIHVWPVSVILSVIALLLGALILEILKAVMNRVSLTVYKRSGKVGVITRLLLLIILFVIIQLVFNLYILFHVLGMIVSGIEIAWFIPIIWPSVAIMNLIKLEIMSTVIFSILSVTFVSFIFEVGSNLRLKFWSPTPVSISLKPSTEYLPQTTVLSGNVFSPLEVAIALKYFRSLVRRKDMARFLAIPIIIAASFILPSLLTPSEDAHVRSLLSAGFIPFIIPLMLSMISVGQEGKGMINICMLPISPKEFIKGKLLTVWIISSLATIGTALGSVIIKPMGTQTIIAIIIAGLPVVVMESFIGLGIGSRYPDYTGGPRSRYVTFKGFLIGLLGGGLLALLIFTPLGLYILSSQNLAPLPTLNIMIMLPTTIIIGSALSYFAYRFCKRGVEALISNFEI